MCDPALDGEQEKNLAAQPGAPWQTAHLPNQSQRFEAKYSRPQGGGKAYFSFS